jgi:alpha-tubulin suppressor-like RCC1 family protein
MKHMTKLLFALFTFVLLGNPLMANGAVMAWGDDTGAQSDVPAGLSNVTAVAAGGKNSVAVKSDGTVVAWGENNFGQLNIPLGLNNATAVAAGWGDIVALKSDGTVVAWGRNEWGQANVPAGLSNVTAIASGQIHTLALKSDGTVVAWGHGGYGETTIPAGLSGVIAIAAGDDHSVALKSDGTVVAWGHNNNGQATAPPGLSGVKGIAAGARFTVALKSDGTIVAWGDNTYGQINVPAGLSNVTAIASGLYHTVALQNDGTVVVWGDNTYGQLNIPAGLTGVSAIAAGGCAYHTVALLNAAPLISQNPQNMTVTSGGTATFSVTAAGTPLLSYQWNFNGNAIANATNSTLALVNVQPTDAGLYSVLVSNAYGSTNSKAATLSVTGNPLLANGAVVAWGDDTGGQSDVPAGLSNVMAVAAGGKNSVAVKSDGTVVAWGENNFGQLNIPIGLNNVTAVAAGWGDIIALKSDGTVVAWGRNEWGQANVPAGLSNVTAIASGQIHTLALKSDGTVAAWGHGGYGETTVPAGLSGVIAIAAGDDHSVALKSDGTVVAWGHNNNGQATAPTGLSGVKGIAAGARFTVALKNDGTVVAWGDDTYGQINVPAGLSNVTAIACGLYHTVALKNDGTVVAWGDNTYGQLNIPAGLTSVSTIAAGGCAYHTVALLNAAPFISQNPQNMTVTSGGTATFRVTATGTPLLSYQWNFNGNAIANATNSTLTLVNVQPTDAGLYSVFVSNAYGSTNSATATLLVVIPLVITQQPQSQTVLSYNSASFSVSALGTSPLSYQWRKNGANLVDGGNISGSTTTNLTLASVSLSDSGNYDVIVSNPYATTNSANAVLTVPQTMLSLGSATTMSGNSVVVPVLMNALGVENTFLATVGYDPTKLALQSVQLGQDASGAYLQEVDTQTNNGYVGFAVLLNDGVVMPAGTNAQVALLTFQTLPVTNNTTVNLFFTNSPTDLETYDNEFNLLPTVYSGATVTLLPAEYAADVYPRTNNIGDHQVKVQDWLEMGRMVAGLDTPTNSDEMLRADCAPRNAPDGLLTVADWVQAGRYSLGLDPLTLVVSPSSPNITLKAQALGPAPARILQIGSVSAQRGQTVNVPVQLVCVTNENAVGMTIGFDTNRLKYVGASLGSAMTGGRININSDQPGKLGMAIAMSPGAALAPATNQILVLQFTTKTNASGPANLTLDSSVAVLQVADKTANALTTTYVDGAVMLPPQPSVAVTGVGANLQFNWSLASGIFQVQTADNPMGPWTTISMPTITNGDNISVTIYPTNLHQFFRLQGQ